MIVFYAHLLVFHGAIFNVNSSVLYVAIILDSIAPLLLRAAPPVRVFVIYLLVFLVYGYLSSATFYAHLLVFHFCYSHSSLLPLASIFHSMVSTSLRVVPSIWP